MKRSKYGSFFLLILGLFFATAIPVKAYVDPSVLTYAIQALAGIAITLGTFLGLYGRKLLKLFGGGTKNTRSITKDDLVFHDPKNGDVRALSFLSEAQLEQLRRDEETWDKTERQSPLLPGILVTLAVSILWMMYSPLMLYLGNVSEFRYDIYSIFPTVLLMFAVGMVTGTIVYFIAHRLGRNPYRFMLGFGLVFLIVTFVQGTFLAGSLPALDGRKFNWEPYQAERIQSLILIVAVLAAVLFLALRHKGAHFLPAVSLISALMSVMMIVTIVITGLQTGGFAHKRSASVTTAEEFTYSTDRNLILLVIDATDSEVFRQLMETEDPEYTEYFRDFTYYPNTVGCYTYTEHAVPFILTGQWMENQEAFESFETKAMDQSPLLRELEERKYRLGVYEDALVYEGEGIYRFENVADDHYKLDSFGEYARQSFYMTWFQYMPYQLKPYLASEDMLSNLQNRAIGQTEAFTSSNTEFFTAAKEKEIRYTEENCFRFIHIEGAHVPFRYDKDLNVIPMEEGTYEQNVQAAMTAVHAYLEKLKAGNVYDNSAIIVLADHGYSEEEPLLGRANPFLMIKGVNETHPLIISEAPVSYEDLQDTYRDLLNEKQSEDILQFDENTPRPRRFLAYDYNNPNHMTEYLQNGYASDLNTMTPTGVEYNR